MGARVDFLIVDSDPAADIARVADRAHHRMVVTRGAVAARTVRDAQG